MAGNSHALERYPPGSARASTTGHGYRNVSDEAPAVVVARRRRGGGIVARDRREPLLCTRSRRFAARHGRCRNRHGGGCLRGDRQPGGRRLGGRCARRHVHAAGAGARVFRHRARGGRRTGSLQCGAGGRPAQPPRALLRPRRRLRAAPSGAATTGAGLFGASATAMCRYSATAWNRKHSSTDACCRVCSPPGPAGCSGTAGPVLRVWVATTAPVSASA